MARLTNWDREQILNKLLTNAFEARQEELDGKISGFGVKMYNELYPKTVQDIMAKLPPNAFPTDDDVQVSFAGKVCRVSWGASRPIFYKHQYGAVVSVFDANHPMCEEWRNLETQQDELAEERLTVENKIKAIIYSVTTLAKLIQIWPEVKPFCSHIESSIRSAKNLPAIIPADLNSTLGLPAVCE